MQSKKSNTPPMLVSAHHAGVPLKPCRADVAYGDTYFLSIDTKRNDQQVALASDGIALLSAFGRQEKELQVLYGSVDGVLPTASIRNFFAVCEGSSANTPVVLKHGISVI